jgi:hypothetical protein
VLGEEPESGQSFVSGARPQEILGGLVVDVPGVLVGDVNGCVCVCVIFIFFEIAAIWWVGLQSRWKIIDEMHLFRFMSLESTVQRNRFCWEWRCT